MPPLPSSGLKPAVRISVPIRNRINQNPQKRKPASPAAKNEPAASEPQPVETESDSSQQPPIPPALLKRGRKPLRPLDLVNGYEITVYCNDGEPNAEY